MKAIVQAKNFLPTNVTIAPNKTKRGPRRYGLSARKLLHELAENTGQAFLWLTVIIGSQELL